MEGNFEVVTMHHGGTVASLESTLLLLVGRLSLSWENIVHVA
jgi:hypothetical protein